MKAFILLVFILFNINTLFSQQGCETLLMNGVFNTFSSSSGNYSSADWHNYWCNGTVEKTGSSSSINASLNVLVESIPLGLSFDDAREFQRVYKSIYCGSNSGNTINVSTNTVIQKVASPEILNAYVLCKEIENGGLKVNLNLRPADNKVFVIDMKFTKPWGNDLGPIVKSVIFVPNEISIKGGTLKEGIGLKTGITYSLIGERSADIPLTVYIETEVGTFSANLPSFIPPPTDQDRIMNSMPKGTILGWFDSNKIPKGWMVCDGSNGSPDLIERFPIGTNLASANIGTKIGETSHTHTFNGTTSYETKHKNLKTPAGMQGEGSACMYHSHTYAGTTESTANIPPATRILFIMKL